MYNNIAEFREFIANANEEKINKVIEFINMAGYYDGAYGDSCNDNELIILAMNYASSDYTNIKSYFSDNIDVVWS